MNSKKNNYADEVVQCFELLGLDDIEELSDVGYLYKDLKNLACIDRLMLTLGPNIFHRTVEVLGGPLPTRRDLARCLLFFTQFFSEVLREMTLTTHIRDNFEGDGVKTLKKYLIFQYEWSLASNKLQRNVRVFLTFDVFYDNDEVSALTDDELNNVYDVLKPLMMDT